MLANDAALAKRCQQFVGTIEVRHFDVRRTNALGIVSIGAHARRQVEGVREFDRGEVVRVVSNLGVEHFDDIQVARLGQRLQHRPPQSGALGIKRVRRIHQPALRFDALNHLGNREDVRNTLGQEQADQFSRRGADLFADDDPNSKIAIEGLSRLDGVVVRDAHHIKLCRLHALGQLVQRGARITRGDRVQMTVKTNPAGRGRWWWPNGTQQQEGD